MNIKEASEAIDSFFDNDKLKVLFLKGPWGSGKSTFVRTYLAAKHSKAPGYQYFVSLFGLTSLNEVRESINANFHNASLKGSFLGNVQSNASKLPKAATKFKEASEAVGFKPFGDVTALVASVGTSLFWLYAKTQKSIIVFDDLERTSLGAAQILGLASSLAENTKAKIIVIFNEEKLDETAMLILNEYREKVVDLEILFQPTVNDLVDEFLVEEAIKEPVKEMLNSIKAANIRLLNKINIHLAQFQTLAAQSRLKLSVEEQTRAAKIICLHYASKRTLTPEMVANGLFGLYLNQKSASEQDTQLASIAKALKIFPPYPLDGLVLELIQNGYCSEESKAKYFEKRSTHQARDEFNSDLMLAYSKYGDNFTASASSVFVDMEAFLTKHSKAMGTDYFAGHLKFLSELGYTKSAEPWKKQHLAVIRKSAKASERVEMAKKLLPSKVVSEFIREEESARAKQPDATSIVYRIIKSQSWGPEDIEALNRMSEDEICSWISSNTDSAFIDNLRDLYRIWANSASTANYWKKLDSALKRISRRSQLDKLRVKNLFVT